MPPPPAPAAYSTHLYPLFSSLSLLASPSLPTSASLYRSRCTSLYPSASVCATNVSESKHECHLSCTRHRSCIMLLLLLPIPHFSLVTEAKNSKTRSELLKLRMRSSYDPITWIPLKETGKNVLNTSACWCCRSTKLTVRQHSKKIIKLSPKCQKSCSRNTAAASVNIPRQRANAWCLKSIVVGSGQRVGGYATPRRRQHRGG